jgi:hypothetical protein
MSPAKPVAGQIAGLNRKHPKLAAKETNFSQITKHQYFVLIDRTKERRYRIFLAPI